MSDLDELEEIFSQTSIARSHASAKQLAHRRRIAEQANNHGRVRAVLNGSKTKHGRAKPSLPKLTFMEGDGE